MEIVADKVTFLSSASGKKQEENDVSTVVNVDNDEESVKKNATNKNKNNNKK